MNKVSLLILTIYTIMKGMKFLAIIITILALVACYYCGDLYLFTGSKPYLWLHVPLLIGLTLYIPQLICGKKYNIVTCYMIEWWGGFIWAMWNMYANKVMLTTLYPTEKNEFLLLDAGLITMTAIVAVTWSAIAQKQKPND